MNKKLSWLVLSVLCLLIITGFYHEILFHPNDYLFSNQGDGLKNYFTFYYQVVHDSSYVNFGGMNYPYGEHFVYTDCHPVLVVILKFLSHNIPFLATHGIGILNFLMIFSIFLTFFLVYKLLLEFDINRWFAIAYSIGITFLAPQILRLTGHLALSYSIAIPLSWLLLIRLIKTEKKLLTVILLWFNNIFWLFVHSYLGLVVIFFQASWLLLWIFGLKEKPKRIINFLYIIITVFLPLSFFYVFTKLTDTHTERTDNPSGFFLYNAEPDDILLPSHAPVRPLLDNLLGDVIKQKWEALAYIGLPSVIILIVLIILGIKYIINKERASLLPALFDKPMLNRSLIAAFIVLLFAMGLPFKLFPGLLDYFPLIKQFRATGRFTWPFFFVFTVFSVYVCQKLYSRFNKDGKHFQAVVIHLLPALFFIWEGYYYQWEAASSIIQSKNIFLKENISYSYKEALEKIKPENFQAILPLPFYYQGSESYSRPRIENSVRSSIILSFHTGLPILGANLTRTSVEESKKIVQVVTPSFYEKEILKDIKSNKPFLIVKTHDRITENEELLLKKAVLFFENEAISLYTLSRDALFRNTADEYFDKYGNIKNKLFSKNGFMLTDSSSFLFYNSFEDRKSAHIFRGQGAFAGKKEGKNTFAEFGPHTFEPAKEYEVSLWMYNNSKDALNDWLRFIIEEHDESNDTWYETVYFPESCEVINGSWSLMQGKFKVHRPENKLYIVCKGKERSRDSLYADDLLIKESGVEIYKLNMHTLFYNNHALSTITNNKHVK